MVEQNLAQKINKIKVNIMTHHITYDVSHDLNPEDLSIGRLYIEQGLKITILHYYNLTNTF